MKELTAFDISAPTVFLMLSLIGAFLNLSLMSNQVEQRVRAIFELQGERDSSRGEIIFWGVGGAIFCAVMGIGFWWHSWHPSLTFIKTYETHYETQYAIARQDKTITMIESEKERLRELHILSQQAAGTSQSATVSLLKGAVYDRTQFAELQGKLQARIDELSRLTTDLREARARTIQRLEDSQQRVSRHEHSIFSPLINVVAQLKVLERYGIMNREHKNLAEGYKTAKAAFEEKLKEPPPPQTLDILLNDGVIDWQADTTDFIRELQEYQASLP